MGINLVYPMVILWSHYCTFISCLLSMCGHTGHTGHTNNKIIDKRQLISIVICIVCNKFGVTSTTSMTRVEYQSLKKKFGMTTKLAYIWVSMTKELYGLI